MDGPSPQGITREARRKRRRQSTVPTMGEAELASSPRELGHMRAGHVTGSTSFVGSGSGIHFVRTVRSAFARNSRRGSEEMDDGLVPGEDDRLQMRSSPSSLWRADEVEHTSQNQTSDPSFGFDDMVRWSQPYFNNWHPPFPFLHAPSILGHMERIYLNGIQSLSSVEAMMVRSVMSISVADRRQMPRESGSNVPSQLIFNTIEEAISCLESLLILPSTLAGLQAAVCIQVFLISMLRLNAASRLGGLIVRMAFHLGLHRCPSRFKQFSKAEIDIRRRLFWCIYCIERYLSQSLGLPLDLKDDDIDVCYPNRELHIEGVETSPNDHRMLLPAFLAKHGYIKGLILELRNKSVLHSNTDQDDVIQVESEISKWWNEAQDLLDPSFMNEDLAISDRNPVSELLRPSHKLLLMIQKHESVILLNRPVITSGYNTSVFAAAMQKCIGASKAIVLNVYQHLQDGFRIEGTGDGRIQSPLFWPGFTWCVWMSGLILLYAASEGYYNVGVAQREAGRCVQILNNLSLRGNFWPGACATAIKDLQQALSHKIANGKNGNPLAEKSAKDTVATSNWSYTTEQYWRNPMSSTSLESAPNTNSLAYSSTRLPGTSAILIPHDHSNDSPSTILSPPPPMTANSQNSLGQSAEGDQSFFLRSSADYPSLWQDMNLGYHSANSQFDGLNDIFHLMDASYHLSEQMYEPPNLAWSSWGTQEIGSQGI